MADEQLVYKIRWDSDNSGIASARKGIQGLGTSLAGLSKLAIGVFAGFVTGKIAQQTNEYRKQLSQLSLLTGGTENAKSKLSELASVSEKTVHTTNQLRDAFVQMNGAGINVSAKGLEGLSALAVGTGSEMGELSKAVARLSLGRVRRLENILETKIDFDGNRALFEFDGQLIETTGGADALIAKLSKLGKSKFGNAVTEEQRTIGVQMQKLRQSLTDLAIAFGVGFDKETSDVIGDFAGIVKSMGPVFEALGKGVGRVVGMISKLTQQIEKSKFVKWLKDVDENSAILQAIPVFLAAIVTAMAGFKVFSGIKTAITMFQGLAVAVGLVSWQFVLIVAVIALVLLVLEDIYQFFQGNDSLTKRAVDKWGQPIKEFFAKIKQFFREVWQGAKKTFNQVKDELSVLFEPVRVLIDYWKSLFKALFALFKGDTDSAMQHFKNAIQGVAEFAFNIAKSIVKAVFFIIDATINAIVGAIGKVAGLIDKAAKFAKIDLNLQGAVEDLGKLDLVSKVDDPNSKLYMGNMKPQQVNSTNNVGRVEINIDGTANMSPSDVSNAVTKGVRGGLDASVTNLAENY